MSTGLALSGGLGQITAQLFVPLQLFSGDFLYLAVVFFLLAIVAGVLGSRGVAGISMEIAKWMVIIFVVLAVISLVL